MTSRHLLAFTFSISLRTAAFYDYQVCSPFDFALPGDLLVSSFRLYHFDFASTLGCACDRFVTTCPAKSRGIRHHWPLASSPSISHIAVSASLRGNVLQHQLSQLGLALLISLFVPTPPLLAFDFDENFCRHMGTLRWEPPWPNHLCHIICFAVRHL